MLMWFFTTIWHALFGLVLLVTVLGGSIIIIAKALARGVEHDRARCECAECKNIRLKAIDKKYQSEESSAISGQWLTTRELKLWTRIVSRTNKGYRVANIQSTDAGIKVTLHALKGGQQSIVVVPWPQATRKMWKVL